MDATISYDEVAALVGINIPTLEPHPNFERIRTLHWHFERALQCLPCPQSVQHGWKAADDSNEDTAITVPTQMAALTYQSQLTAATATNASQRMDQYVQTLTQQQEQLHQMQHQIMEQLATLSLNHGNGDRGVGRQGRPHPPPPTPFAPNQFGCHNFGNGGEQGRGRGSGRGCGPPAFTGGHTTPPHVYH
jgi:hypothetical protein